MPNPTLKDAFTLVQTNLTALTRAALSDMTEVLAYVDVIPNAYPLTQFYMGRGRFQTTSASTQSFTFAMEMDVTVAEFRQSYDGQAQQMAQFSYLPQLIQYLYQHSSLMYNSVSVPFLDIINSQMDDFGIQVRENRLVIVINWTLIFMTSFDSC